MIRIVTVILIYHLHKPVEPEDSTFKKERKEWKNIGFVMASRVNVAFSVMGAWGLSPGTKRSDCPLPPYSSVVKNDDVHPQDRLCGLMFRGPGSISGTTRLSEK
jgi:hypothetical protein